MYDSTRLWIVISRDFSSELSRETSEAWNRFAQSLRIVGRFALAAPMPVKSVRKLVVADPGSAQAAGSPGAARPREHGRVVAGVGPAAEPARRRRAACGRRAGDCRRLVG